MQELVWQIVNNNDFESSKKLPLWERTPFIEYEGLTRDEMILEYQELVKKDPGMQIMMDLLVNSVQLTEEKPSPRVIKTHLPFEMLPPNLLDTCKVIFVGRNPKDACVSFYHHHIIFPEYKYKGTFADFAELFMEGNIEFGNYWVMLKVSIFNMTIIRSPKYSIFFSKL